MRVLFITEDDPLYVIEFFSRFFRERPAAVEVVGITISRPWDESRWATAMRVLRFYGPLDFVRLSMRYARARLQRRSIGTLAHDHSIPILPTPSVNDPAYVERIRKLEPDVIISVAAPEIFRAELLEIPRLGCLNLHSGRLPEYRGMMPTFWQVVRGEPSVTVTVHEMAPQLDAGAVLGTAEVAISQGATLADLMAEAKREGARLMIEVLAEVRAGRVRPAELDLDAAGYYSFPKSEDVRAFRQRGHRLL